MDWRDLSLDMVGTCDAMIEDSRRREAGGEVLVRPRQIDTIALYISAYDNDNAWPAVSDFSLGLRLRFYATKRKERTTYNDVKQNKTFYRLHLHLHLRHR